MSLLRRLRDWFNRVFVDDGITQGVGPQFCPACGRLTQ